MNTTRPLALASALLSVLSALALGCCAAVPAPAASPAAHMTRVADRALQVQPTAVVVSILI